MSKEIDIANQVVSRFIAKSIKPGGELVASMAFGDYLHNEELYQSRFSNWQSAIHSLRRLRLNDLWRELNDISVINTKIARTEERIEEREQTVPGYSEIVYGLMTLFDNLPDSLLPSEKDEYPNLDKQEVKERIHDSISNTRYSLHRQIIAS